MALDKLRLEVQSVLDDLWTKKLIPFELTAQKVEYLGMEEYIIRFYDGRLRSVDVSSNNCHSFKDAVRVAVIARAARITGPSQRAANKAG
jgi:hypothetical protein